MARRILAAENAVDSSKRNDPAAGEGRPEGHLLLIHLLALAISYTNIRAEAPFAFRMVSLCDVVGACGVLRGEVWGVKWFR